MKIAPRLQRNVRVFAIDEVQKVDKRLLFPCCCTATSHEVRDKYAEEVQKDTITRSQSDAEWCPHTWPRWDLGPPCKKKKERERETWFLESEAISRFGEPRPKNDRLSCRKDFFPTHTFRNKTSKPASEEWSNPGLKLQEMMVFIQIKENMAKIKTIKHNRKLMWELKRMWQRKLQPYVLHQYMPLWIGSAVQHGESWSFLCVGKMGGGCHLKHNRTRF